MAQLININSTEFRRCNLSAIQSGGTWASIIPDENEIILISTTNALTADGSGKCDAYIIGDGTTAASALELKPIADGEIALKKEIEDIEEILEISQLAVQVTCTIYKDGYYIGNGNGTGLGEEVSFSGRAIANSTGWQIGNTIIINRIRTAGVSSCAVALYKNGVFVANLINGNGGFLPDVPYEFTPNIEYDEVRFSLFNSDALNTLEVYRKAGEKYSAKLDAVENRLDGIDDDVESIKEQLVSVEYKTHTVQCVTHGYLNPDGSVEPNNPIADRGVTDFLPVKGTLHIVRAFSPYTPKTFVCFYDETKTRCISNEDNTSQGVAVTNVSLPVPDGAVYARIVQEVFDNTTTYSTYEEVSAINKLESITNNLSERVDTFRFLLIGSSFGVNTIMQFPFIAKAGGIKIVCGCLYEGGGTLQDVVNIINGSNTFDNAWVYTYENNGWQVADTDLDTMLSYTDWDVISVQRAASERGVWDATKANNLQTIIEYIQGKTQSYNPKIIFNSIFAYPVFSAEKTAQLQDTENIVSTCQLVQEQFGLEIIPTAIAVQNARMTKLIAKGSVNEAIPDLAEDSMHLDTGVGSYVCGALLYEYLIGARFGKSILTNSYVPALNDVATIGIFSQTAYTQPTAEDIIISKYAAMMAYRNQSNVNEQIGIRYPYAQT